MKNCIAFLTKIPVNKEVDIFKEVAPKMWLFPIVGFILGIILSIIGLFLLSFLPFLLVGFILLGLLLLMTGVHHADGLFDFGDGLMVMGTPERKIEVMHDVNIGAGGFALGFIILSLTGIAISYSMEYLIIALVLSEIGAKFNMVAVCSVGRSAKTKMVDQFIISNKKKHLIMSLMLSIILILITLFLIVFYNFIYDNIVLFRYVFSPISNVSPFNLYQCLSIFIVFLIGTAISLIIILNLANKHFNGLTGDCIGALNEITRLTILILFLVIDRINLI
ncbi:MAG: adenosylcobinamide-GDP ribazoletransferase [Promethearchaeota archaeon]